MTGGYVICPNYVGENIDDYSFSTSISPEVAGANKPIFLGVGIVTGFGINHDKTLLINPCILFPASVGPEKALIGTTFASLEGEVFTVYSLVLAQDGTFTVSGAISNL